MLVSGSQVTFKIVMKYQVLSIRYKVPFIRESNSIYIDLSFRTDYLDTCY